MSVIPQYTESCNNVDPIGGGDPLPVNRLANGGIADDELQHLIGVVAPIQEQLEGKAPIAHTHPASDILGLPGAIAGGLMTIPISQARESDYSVPNGDGSWTPNGAPVASYSTSDGADQSTLVGVLKFDSVIIPANYVSGSTLTVAVNAHYTEDVGAGGGGTVAVVLRQLSKAGVLSSDKITTGAAALTGTAADHAFLVPSPSGISAGDEVSIVVTVTVSNANEDDKLTYGNFNSIRLGTA